MRYPRFLLALFACALIAAGCGDAGDVTVASPTLTPTTLTPTTPAPTTIEAPTTALTTAAPTTAAPTGATTATEQPTSAAPTATSTTEPVGSEPIQIRLRLDRRVDDDATADFAPITEAVLTDERGWSRAGFEFTFSETDYDYTVILAEGSEVDLLCLPYDTGGRFSCQIGPIVALNAGRWRTAVESWPGSLDEYRTMLVNHEVGHLIGQHHPASRCPAEGQPAPVMSQQSSGVAPCTANPWPLDWEIECASQGIEPLAPPYETNIQLTCGP